MSKQEYTVRNAKPGEFEEIGKLMVQAYSQLEGFPIESEQPNYYKMLAKYLDKTSLSPDNTWKLDWDFIQNE